VLLRQRGIVWRRGPHAFGFRLKRLLKRFFYRVGNRLLVLCQPLSSARKPNGKPEKAEREHHKNRNKPGNISSMLFS